MIQRKAITRFGIPLFVIVAMVSGCTRDKSQAPAGPLAAVRRTVQEAPASATAQQETEATIEEEEAEVWSRLLNKSSCNLLHGCPAAEELVAMGTSIAAKAAARLKDDRGDRIWRFALARALVSVRDGNVQRWQDEALSHHQWLIRAYGAIGLGRNTPDRFRKRAERLLAEEKHPGVRLGILWGRTLARGKGARQHLTEFISKLPATADIRVELMALDAIRGISLVEALPSVRIMLNHPNFFVVRDAVQTVQSLLDHQSIPLIIPLLSHERKLVRDGVLATLRRLTGQRNKRTRASFERWCKEHCEPDLAP